MLANAFADLELSDQLKEIIAEKGDDPHATEDVALQVLEFADVLSFGPLIPIEQSPLDYHALTSLATTAGMAGLGVAVALLAVPSGPLVLLAVPAGIIIVYAADAVGDGLGQRIRNWLMPKRWRGAKKEEQTQKREAERKAKFQARQKILHDLAAKSPKLRPK